MGKKYLKYLGLVFLAVVIFTSAKTYADQTQTISIGPAIISLNLSAGTSLSKQLSVTNQGTLGYDYNLYASPYGVDSQTYKPVFKSLAGFANISSWFSFSPSSGYLAPGSRVVINYTVMVPAGISPGSYYAAVFAASQNVVPPAGTTAVGLNQRVGSLFYIDIAGSASEKGAISSWHVNFFQSPPAVADLKLSNYGKLYFVSNINIDFKDILGGSKYRLIEQKIVIPKVVRDIPIVWPNSPNVGLYKISGTVTVYGKKYLATKYFLVLSTTAKVVLIIIFVLIILAFSIFNSLKAISKSPRRKLK